MLSSDEEVLSLIAKPVRDAFLERFGSLTPPQLEAIPKILQGKNVLIVAPTGTGKTEAALLPILSNIIMDPGIPGIKALYITPLRALNRDMLERFDWWAKRLDISVSVRHGDTTMMERRIHALKPPDIMITTPETLQAILCGKLMRNHLKSVRWVVIDEIHELATDKRGVQLSLGLERLREITNVKFQRIGLSATIGTPELVASFLAGVNEDFEIVYVPVERGMVLDVMYPMPDEDDLKLSEELAILPDVAARLSTIRKLVESHESTLIFTNTRPLAEILTSRFRAWDESFKVGIHHGSLARPARVSVEEGLKTGKLLGIVCTSSLELGIDVGRINLVIQYNSPREVTRLIQRVGRSGHRIGRVAKGVVIVMDSDDALESIVIIRRALAGELEKFRIPTGCLDVLMHQLAGVMLERKGADVDWVLRVFRRSFCYSDLTRETVQKVLKHMKSLNMCWISEDGNRFWKLPRSKALYEYYFGNLSMIPEEKQYLVVDGESEQPVGILDEEFVSEYGEPGTRFILHGRAWEIMNMVGEKIYVKKIEDYEGAIPSWVGDEIPVPLEVALEVGSIRRFYEEKYLSGLSHETICEELSRMYNISKEIFERSLEEVRKHILLGIPVPTDRRILLEKSGDYVIIHIHGGLRINRTLAKVISYKVSERIGAPVATQQDPYRIALRSKFIEIDDVRSAMLELSREDLQELIMRVLEGSTLFKRRLIHVARKMGVIKKEASLLDASVSKIAEALKGTVVYEEAMNYCLFQDFDVEGAKAILNSIINGDLEIKTYVSPDGTTPSPLASLILRRYREAYEDVSSGKIDRILMNIVRSRLMNESGVLICSDCFQYAERVVVKDVEDDPRCPSCGSRKLGFLKHEMEDIYGLVSRRGRAMNRKERGLLREIKKTANLVEKYGKVALLVLSSKWLDVDDAHRILEIESKISNRLIELIVSEEKKKLLSGFR